tara:strand:- start:3107 stop:3481 length:375 start_codon:yes stop_codon:yes gene_type:complete
MSLGKNMMLINSAFKNVKSFSMISISKECPYVEALFDPSSGVLAVITKEKKNTFHMVPKINEKGVPQGDKKQRVQIETYTEYYITSKEDINNFIGIFAINSDFNTEKYMVDLQETKVSKIITPA